MPVIESTGTSNYIIQNVLTVYLVNVTGGTTIHSAPLNTQIVFASRRDSLIYCGIGASLTWTCGHTGTVAGSTGALQC
jgi:hypothetical protein